MLSEGLLGVIVGGLIVFISNFSLIFYNDYKNAKNIENAIVADIESIEKRIKEYSKLHSSNENVNRPLDVIQPFYPDNGIYYRIQEDIQKLCKNQAKIIYKFYINLMIAESERKLTQQLIKENPQIIDPSVADNYPILSSRSQEVAIASSKSMVFAINEASNLIDEIKKI
ncbi:MAG: hypothetical protein JW931_04675 [Methanomicrobiaceae archaeon]|nr:hypothetical protein [Methanomicrobiaceae archaeon]